MAVATIGLLPVSKTSALSQRNLAVRNGHVAGCSNLVMASPFLPAVTQRRRSSSCCAVRAGSAGPPQRPGGKIRGGTKDSTKDGNRVTGVPVRGVPADADTFWAAGHGRHHHDDMPAQKMSAEEREIRVKEVQREIQAEIVKREEKLKAKALSNHLDSELKFGKLLISQGQFSRAYGHLDKVTSKSASSSYQQCEATFFKAQCLEQMDRKDEARDLYDSLVQHRAPYAHVKRKAAQALWKLEANKTKNEGGRTNFGGNETKVRAEGVMSSGDEMPEEENKTKSSLFEEYLYQMYMTGFGSYHPKEKYVESRQEKMLTMIIPASILLMGPFMIGWLLLHQ